MRAFWQDSRGSVAVLVALCAMVLVLIAGAVIDFGTSLYVRNSLQASVDAAALAAGKTDVDPKAAKATTEAKLKAVAEAMFAANNKLGNVVTVEPLKLTYDPPLGTAPDTVFISVSASMPTNFLYLVGIPKLDFTLESKSQRPQPGPIDLVLVLDTTLSMGSAPASGGEAKLTTLKAAATDLVNQVMASGSTNVRVGVVPYTSYVNVGLTNPAPNWILPIQRNEPAICLKRSTTDCTPKVYYDCPIDGVMKTNGCVSGGVCSCEKSEPRVYPWNGSVGARSVLAPNNPDDRSKNKFTQDYLTTIKNLPPDNTSTTVPVYSGQNDVSVPTALMPAQIRTLTSNKNDVLATIAALKAGGDTHIPTGLIWGWNVLAPGEPYDARTKAQLDAIGGRKVLLLMTDGINANSPRRWDGAYMPNGSVALTLNPNWRDDGTKSNNLTREICQNIKDDTLGIQIYTVRFDVSDATIKSILEDCATDKNTMSFAASDRDGLLKAFREISDQLTVLKLVK